ncbi:hypothetical protein D9M71_625320 [compost metagenome]
MRGIDRHAEGIGIQLEQRLHAVGEVLLVLCHVGRGDGEQRLFVRVGIERMVAGALEIHMRRRAQPLAGILRNAAVGVAGALGAHAGVGAAQLGQLVRRSIGQHRRGAEREQRTAGDDAGELRVFLHGSLPLHQ